MFFSLIKGSLKNSSHNETMVFVRNVLFHSYHTIGISCMYVLTRLKIVYVVYVFSYYLRLKIVYVIYVFSYYTKLVLSNRALTIHLKCKFSVNYTK